MTAIEDRHARFLTNLRPRLDNLAPVMVGEHGRCFWTVPDLPRDGMDSRVAFLPEGPGLAALESPELADDRRAAGPLRPGLSATARPAGAV